MGVTRPYRLRIVLLCAISMAVSVTGVSFALATRRLIDTATGALEASAGIPAVALPLAGIVLFQLVTQSVLSLLTTNTTENLQNLLRKRLFAKLCRCPWYSLRDFHSGDIMTRMSSDAGNIVSVCTSLIPGVAALCAQIAAAFGALFFYDRIMAFTAFFLGPFVILLARLYGRRLKPFFEKYQKCDSAEKSFLQESVQNLLLIKTFNLYKPFQDKLSELQRAKLGWVYKRNAASVLAGAGMSLGYWLGTLAALLWGSYRLSQGLITFGTVTAFVQLVGQVQGPFMGLSRMLPRFIQASSSAERLRVIDDLPEESMSRCAAVADARAGLSVQHVSFSYAAGKKILDDVTLAAQPGEMLGIMGPTGDGKTTLLRLLLSLVPPDSGAIRILPDNGDTLDAGPETRCYFSYVPQGNSMLSGTIAENLRLGNQEATDGELVEALKDACAWDFISALPDTIHTFVGEKGTTLSEGQSQRIAIARAFLHGTPILVLDEATSALDPGTEDRVIRSIRAKNKTCIFVSHREILFSKCDSVYKITDGRLLKLG